MGVVELCHPFFALVTVALVNGFPPQSVEDAQGTVSELVCLDENVTAVQLFSLQVYALAHSEQHCRSAKVSF